jgi:predicted phosphodiesterase
VTDLMGGDRVIVWIFGHTHRVADLDIRGTRVLSNPRGYPHQPVAGFDPYCVIELGSGMVRTRSGEDAERSSSVASPTGDAELSR